MLKQADRAGWLEAGLSRSRVDYGIKWLGVPPGLATLKGGCFDRAFALRRLGLRLRRPAAHGESLPEALAKAYQTNPALNAERARQRATDENVPQALSGYRPQIVATLSAGFQAVRNLLPDNTIQSANLKPWTIGVTVIPDAVQRVQDRQQRPRGGTAGAVRPRSAAQCRPGRAARRRHRLYQRARQPVAGRGAARQRGVPAGNARHHPEAAQCRRRHADRYRAGRGAPRAAAAPT